MTKDNKNINFKYPFVVFFCFVVFMAVLLYFFNFLHLRRVDAVTQEYVTETQNYINNNRDNLVILFREIFADSECVTGENYNNLPLCPDVRVKDIYAVLPQNLKDFSSTAFIKKNSQYKLLMMRLSGDVSMISSWSNANKHEQTFYDLLEGKREFLPWDEYTYAFPNKEVIIGVKDNQGQIVGAMVRGVIE